MSIPYETLRELEALRARVEELEYELDSIRSTVDTEVACVMDEYDLTVGEAKMVRALAHAHGAPLSRIVLAEVVGPEIENLRTIDSHVKRVRRKNSGRLPIDTMYGIGYRLLPEAAKRIRDIMAGKIEPSSRRIHMYGHEAAA